MSKGRQGRMYLDDAEGAWWVAEQDHTTRRYQIKRDGETVLRDVPTPLAEKLFGLLMTQGGVSDNQHAQEVGRCYRRAQSSRGRPKTTPEPGSEMCASP